MDVWSALEREWAHAANARSARRRLLAWAALTPGLAGFASPGDVVEAIGCMGDSERSSSLLSDLLVVADDSFPSQRWPATSAKTTFWFSTASRKR